MKNLKWLADRVINLELCAHRFMFLNEVALGKQKEIFRDDGSLVAAPAGFDSILAKGRTEPDPKFDEKIKLGEFEVIVPVGKPTTRK